LGLAGSAAADAKRMQNGAAVEANLTGYPAPIGRGRPRAFAGATEMIAIISAMPGEGWGRPVSRSGPASTGAGLVITTGYPFSRDVHSTYWIACHRSMSTCPDARQYDRLQRCDGCRRGMETIPTTTPRRGVNRADRCDGTRARRVMTSSQWPLFRNCWTHATI